MVGVGASDRVTLVVVDGGDSGGVEGVGLRWPLW